MHKFGVRLKVLIALVVLLCALVAVGVLVVLLEAQRQYRVKQDVVDGFAGDLLDDMLGEIRIALTPLQLATPHVQRNPSPAVKNTSVPLMGDWLDLAPYKAALVLLMAYQGQVVLFYNHEASSISDSDVVMPPSLVSNLEYSMRTGRAVIQEVTTGDSQEFLFGVFSPVFTGVAHPSDTWGWPTNMTYPACSNSQPPCYNSTSNQKWWGNIGVLLGRAEIAHCEYLEEAIEEGYYYRMSMAEDAPGLDTPTARAPLVMYQALSSDQCLSNLAKMEEELLPGIMLQVEVCVVSKWALSWVPGAVVAVVIGAILMVALTAWTVQTWMRNSELMESLLPANAIKHLATTVDQSHAVRGADAMSGSPAEKLVSILSMLAAGEEPAMTDVLLVLGVLKQRGNIYLPLDFKQRLASASGMSGEVAAALMAQLGGADSENQRTSALKLDAIFVVEPLTGVDDAEDSQDAKTTRVLEFLAGFKRDEHAPFRNNSTLSSATTLSLEGVDSPFDQQGVTQFHNPLSTLSSIQEPGGTVYRQESKAVLRTTSRTSLASQTGPAPAAALLTRLEQMLCDCDSLAGDFDAWELAAASNNHPLSCLGYWCFQQSGAIQDLNIPVQPLISFLRILEEGYNDNPYHNRTHAADVLQSVHALLHTGGLRRTYADSFATVACYLAAIIHDYDHRGVTNDFLINTRHDLAIAHNDASPHENHHVSASYRLLSQAKHNFLSHLSQAEWARMRKLVIDLVLATDMKRHFAINSTFSSVHQLPTASLVKQIGEGKRLSFADSSQASNIVSDSSIPAGGPGSSPKRQTTRTGLDPSASQILPRKASRSILTTLGDKHYFMGSMERSCRGSADMGRPAPLDEPERLLSLQMLMKCADLGHICTSLHVHLKWVAALEEEMFLQGDQEKALGIPVSPLCDRMGSGVTKSQVSFFEIVVLPLLVNFTQRFTVAHGILDAAAANYHYWRGVAKKQPSMEQS